MAAPSYNVIVGTRGDDDLSGTSGNDYFAVQQGGDDTLSGLDGNDIFAFHDALNPNDSVDGGAGADTLRLNGDAYADGITLGAGTIMSVEKIMFGAGFDYALTTNDGNVAAGQQLGIDAVCLQSGDSLIFNGAAETDGSFRLVGGAGVNNLTGGANGDTFILRFDGEQGFIHGGGGDDRFIMLGTLDAADQIDGGTGNDIMVLQGIDTADTIVMNATTITSIEKLVLEHGYNYNFTGDDGNIAAHATMTVVDRDLDPGANSFFYDGSAETDGHFNFIPEESIATLIGGAQHDRFNLSIGSGDTVTGGGGADLIVAGVGGDTFVYNAASDSTSIHYDTITGVDFQSDTFIAPWGTLGSEPEIFSGISLSKATFDSDLAAASGSRLSAHGAIIVGVSSGDLAGHSFLVIDVNGTIGYQAGADLVIDVTGYTGIQT